MCRAQLGLTYPKAAKFQTWQKYFMSGISFFIVVQLGMEDVSASETRAFLQKSWVWFRYTGMSNVLFEQHMYIADNEHPGHVIQSQPPRRLCAT